MVFHNLGGGYVQEIEIKAMSNVKLYVRPNCPLPHDHNTKRMLGDLKNIDIS